MRSKSYDKAKTKHKKGLWSPDEDQRLRDYVMKYGHACWSSVPIHAGLQRSGKSCRLRWINYLRPGLKRGAIGIAEEETILNLHQILDNKWSQIALHLPGRTDNEIKNYWHSFLKKGMSIMAETKFKATKNDYINGEIQVELSSSSTNSTPGNSSFESLRHKKRSLMDTDQFMQQIDHSRGVTQRCSLPKVLFAEWFSFDQFNDNELVNYSKSNADNHFEDTLVDGLLQKEGTFGVETNTKTNEVYVDDIMLQSPPFKVEYHTPGNGYDYFPEESCMNFDDTYA